MNYLVLVFEYLKIGIFNIGGGLATLPFIYQLAAKYNWWHTADIPEMLAVSQLVPGAMGVNLMCATGLEAGHILGAVLAVSAFILPAMVIIIVVEKAYAVFKQNKVVQNVFCGLRPAAAGLLASAGCLLLSSVLINLNA
ncbi:MAG: chromate transporter, partial [Spirochaetaceae bacterium]|nr:chromate transporter [Spirochaetaceae bacterium]